MRKIERDDTLPSWPACLGGPTSPVVGLSKPGKNRTFQGLPLDDRLKQKDAEARAGLLVVDLKSGDTPDWLRIEGVVEELYDVAVLPGVRRPSLIGFKTDEVRRTLRLP